MEVGMKGTDIAMLQKCLGYLTDASGFLFPLYQEPTGWYGGITRDSVQRFQTLYKINPIGRVGPETLAKLNEVFA
jgi:peptidoglycan hydrolase-like protein with peptidoglycan-binding domain